MDFVKAGLVVASTYALVEWGKAVVPFRVTSRWQVLMAFIAGQVGVWGLATTVWAHEQVISGHALDTLNTGSKFAAGFFVGLLASGSERLIGMVKNIGQNTTQRPTVK